MQDGNLVLDLTPYDRQRETGERALDRADLLSILIGTPSLLIGFPLAVFMGAINDWWFPITMLIVLLPAFLLIQWIRHGIFHVDRIVLPPDDRRLITAHWPELADARWLPVTGELTLICRLDGEGNPVDVRQVRIVDRQVTVRDMSGRPLPMTDGADPQLFGADGRPQSDSDQSDGYDASDEDRNPWFQ